VVGGRHPPFSTRSAPFRSLYSSVFFVFVFISVSVCLLLLPNAAFRPRFGLEYLPLFLLCQPARSHDISVGLGFHTIGTGYPFGSNILETSSTPHSSCMFLSPQNPSISIPIIPFPSNTPQKSKESNLDLLRQPLTRRSPQPYSLLKKQFLFPKLRFMGRFEVEEGDAGLPRGLLELAMTGTKEIEARNYTVENDRGMSCFRLPGGRSR